MMPQFNRPSTGEFKTNRLLIGLVIFVIGLFKKVVLADGIAVYATPVFNAADHGAALTFFDAWGGALAYTFQIYFDFSGYSDMAIGLARMFGIRLPLNFHSPYRAVNIIEFWRCWHMTLSRFLRDYLYIPLGGSRKSTVRRYLNLSVTMVLGGLWHGASWTFIAWGALHGVFLIINHGFRAARRSLGHDLNVASPWGRGIARLLTFAAVVIAWVFFRANTVAGAQSMLSGMFGFNGLVMPATPDYGFLAFLVSLLLITWYLPNTQEFLADEHPALKVYRNDVVRPSHGMFLFTFNSYVHAFLISMMVTLCFVFIFTRENSEFLYYNF